MLSYTLHPWNVFCLKGGCFFQTDLSCAVGSNLLLYAETAEPCWATFVLQSNEGVRWALNHLFFFPLSRWWQKSKPRLHFNGLANVRPNCLGHCDEQPGDGSHGDDRTAPPARCETLSRLCPPFLSNMSLGRTCVSWVGLMEFLYAVHVYKLCLYVDVSEQCI